jgi:hypothetical protein
MNIAMKIIIGLLVFLAVSSGLTKVTLMPQDVEFFGAYGFTDPILIAYGATQITGGVLMIMPKWRIYGAILVAITFLISLVVLLMAGNVMMAGITFLATGLLGLVIIRSRKRQHTVQALSGQND